MAYRSSVLFAAAVLVAGGASAATVDFTDRSVWSSAASTAHVAGALVSLSSTGGEITFAQDFDRSPAPACAGFGGALVCDSDGLGVRDDEITTRAASGETVTVDFSAPVKVTALSFLDLYIAADQSDFESVEVFFNGDIGTLTTFDAVEVFDFSTAGFARFDVPHVLASSLTFRAAPGNDEIGFADFALAAIEVAPVPLPAAGWMLLAGVGGLAALRRRA